MINGAKKIKYGNRRMVLICQPPMISAHHPPMISTKKLSYPLLTLLKKHVYIRHFSFQLIRTI